MASHIKVLGILHLVFAGLQILIGLMFLMVFGSLVGVVASQSNSSDAAAGLAALGGMGTFLFLLLLIFSVPGIITGYGLIKFKPWGRIMGIVMSCLQLLNIPFGTALGVYGLWALLSTEGEAVFRQQPQAMMPPPLQPY